jgi:hypothetical protein
VANLTRRSLLRGLGATLFVAPAIVRPENIMKIKSYRTIYPVTIDGFDAYGNHITEIINVPETNFKLDMAYYRTETEIIRPKFAGVYSISWPKAMKLVRSREVEWTREFDPSKRLNFIHTGSTSFPPQHLEHIVDRYDADTVWKEPLNAERAFREEVERLAEWRT